MACEGYQALPVRTGYEQVIAHRTSDLFAYSARKPGKVISKTPEGIQIEYEDGEVKGFELGIRYGSSEGQTFPHEVVSNLEVGQEVKPGDIVCYNTGFFEQDYLNPSNVIWKAGILARTVLMEAPITLEDSSAISKRVSELLTTKVTKIRRIVLNFDQNIHDLVKQGQAVDAEDILCVIEEGLSANLSIYDEESLDTLRNLSAQTPLAKSKGVVQRIEVFYHGDKDDMSDSLRALANSSDRQLAKRYQAAGKKPFTGSVDAGYRIEGEPLALDTLVINIYITADVPAGIGDKGVFGNQMKTVFGEVLENEIKTEDGVVIDAIFGKKSVDDRIVNSVDVIGTTTTLLEVLTKRALAAYDS